MVKTIIAAVIISFVAGVVTGVRYIDSSNSSKQIDKMNTSILKNLPSEQKSAEVVKTTEVKYKTIYRDVIKYVKNPNRSVCVFDDNSIRLRTEAINDTAIIAGFDDETMHTKPGGKKQR